MNTEIYDEIKRRILYHDYEPGRTLNIKELASAFGVSQTPIRDVLLRLEWEKLVTIVPRGGIMVTKIDFQELRDVFRVRTVVEGAVGKLAARNITDAQLQEMRSLMAACKHVKGENSRHELIEIDGRFRDLLFDAADSPTLNEISKLLYSQTLRVWYMTFDKTNIATEVAVELKEIEDTFEVFSKRDPDLAEKVRQQVIRTWVERTYKYFSDQQ